MAVTSYLVALGANRRSRHGAPAATLAAALDALGDLGTVRAAARPLRTPAMGPAGRAFENGAAILSTPLDPPALLAALKHIERRFGRRPGRRWGPRALDLDIVLWSGGPVRTRRLTVPHPGLPTRAFVLRPALAVAAGWRDPRTGLTVRHLATRLTRRRPRHSRTRVGS